MIESSLSAEEIIRVAMNIEKQGIDFYTEMADRSEQQETEGSFLQLMRDDYE